MLLKFGVTVHEFGGMRLVLVEAIEEEPCMEFLKVLRFCAERKC